MPKTKTVEPELTETPAGESAAPLDPLEVEIEVVAPEGGEAEPVTVETPDAHKEVAVKPAEDDPVVAKLKADLDAATRREAEKDALTARLTGELQTTKAAQQETQIGQIESALDAQRSKMEQLQSALEGAYTNADYSGAAKLQVQIATVASQIGRLEDGRDALKTAKPEIERPQPITDPVEGVIAANPSLPPRDRAWLRAHPDAVTDPEKFQDLVAVSRLALKKFGPQTDGYYAFIEQELGYRKAPEGAQEPPRPAAPQERKAPTYAAPVSRETSGGIGTDGARKGSKVRLSPAQRQAAKDSGVTDAEYAKNLLALVKSGQLQESAVEFVS